MLASVGPNLTNIWPSVAGFCLSWLTSTPTWPKSDNVGRIVLNFGAQVQSWLKSANSGQTWAESRLLEQLVDCCWARRSSSNAILCHKGLCQNHRNAGAHRRGIGWQRLPWRSAPYLTVPINRCRSLEPRPCEERGEGR